MDDLKHVFKNADNPKITENMSDSFPDSLSKWERFLEFAINDKQVFYLAIEIKGKVSGGIGLKPCEDVHRYNAEIGY
jgi:RimJ/RimL family protein N-acetyltransferase